MTRRLLPLLTILFLLCACDPLAPVITPTAQVIIVTPEDTATPVATATTPPTQTPLPSPTPQDTATPTPLPCLQDGGQIIAYDDFRSTIANENLHYRVYIPPCYVETNKRYPYVILLPGLQADETQWGDLGIQQALDQSVRQGTIAPMVVVMPEYGTFGTDNRYAPNPSYEDVVLEELLPAIERDFCTWNDRDHRAIGGISRGGFWALSIAFRHPDIFGIVGGHSAALYTDGVPADVNPLELALRPPNNLRIFIDNGQQDPAGTNLSLFSSRLSSRAIANTYVVSPVGGHDDVYWSGHLQDYLTFYARDWARSVDDLPSCSQPSP